MTSFRKTVSPETLQPFNTLRWDYFQEDTERAQKVNWVFHIKKKILTSKTWVSNDNNSYNMQKIYLETLHLESFKQVLKFYLNKSFSF